MDEPSELTSLNVIFFVIQDAKWHIGSSFYDRVKSNED